MTRLAHFLFIAVLGCSEGEPGPSAPISVGGTYDITRAVVSASCESPVHGVTDPVTGVITHTPGSTHFVLANADGGHFVGALHPDGTWTTGTVQILSYDYQINGRFTASGFTARLTEHITRSMSRCTNVIEWVSVKQGSANVIS